MSSAAGTNRQADGSTSIFKRVAKAFKPSNQAPANGFFENYELHQMLGEGGSALIRVCTRKKGSVESMSTKYAVKIIKRDALSKEDDKALLRKEAEILQQLDHKCIVKAHAFFEERDSFYLVLDLLNGGELFDRIVKKSLYSEREARDLVAKILDTVHYLHEQNVVHRDLKPENFVFTDAAEDADFKLIDFGFAAIAEGNTLTDQCGTPGYVAPEMVIGQPYGKPVDMWAMGVLLFILLGGYPPFHDNNQRLLFEKITKAQFEFHPNYWGSISAEAKQLISSLLVADPEKRLTAAQALQHPWITGDADQMNSHSLGANLERLREFQARRALEEAAKAVSKAWGRSKLTIVGEGRAGKTALCNAITGKSFKQTQSTVGIEQVTMDVQMADISATAVAVKTNAASVGTEGVRAVDHASRWATYVKPEKEYDAALLLLAKKRMIEAAKSTEAAADVAMDATAATVVNVEDQQDASLTTAATADDSNSSSKTAATMHSDVAANDSEAVESSVSATEVHTPRFDFDVLMRKLAETEVSEKNGDSDKKVTLSIFDFGGQSVFNVIHHFFLTRQGVYAVVFNMKDLSCINSSSSDGSDTDSAISTNVLENEQAANCLAFIRFWLNSIVVHTQHENQQHPGRLETAPILLIGTRKDKVSDPAEHGRISTALYNAFHRNEAWSSVLLNESGQGKRGRSTLCFFPVDNTLGRGDETIKDLMAVVEKTVLNADYVQEEKPLSWLQTLDALTTRSGGRCSYLTYSTVLECAADCGVAAAEVPTMLQFLHDMSVLMWHSDPALRDVVILDPIEYFVRPATTIICKHIPTGDDDTQHVMQVHKDCMRYHRDDWDDFVKHGVLSLALLQALLQHEFADRLDTVVRLMLKFGLLVELEFAAKVTTEGSGGQQFLVPALLPLSKRTLLHLQLPAQEFGTQFQRCFFVFSTSKKLLRKQALLPSDLKVQGFLPSGLFERLVGKVVVWSQQTSAMCALETGAVCRDSALLSFGSLWFRMTVHEQYGCIQVDVYGKQPQIIHHRLLELIQKILRECLKSLKCVTMLPLRCHSDDGTISGSGSLNSNADESLIDEATIFVQLNALHDTVITHTTLQLPASATASTIAASTGSTSFVAPLRHLTAEQAKSLLGSWLQVAQAKDQYDVFISYRWNPQDSHFTAALFDRLSSFTSQRSVIAAATAADDEMGGVAVFLDTKRLETGRQFQADFVKALMYSRVAVPVLSAAALERMKRLTADSAVDNLLVEWIIILAMFKAGMLMVVPLLFGCIDSSTCRIGDFFSEQHAQKLPDVVPVATLDCAVQLLHTLDDAVPSQSQLQRQQQQQYVCKAVEAMSGDSVRSIVSSLLSFLGFKAWDHQPPLLHSAAAAEASADALKTSSSHYRILRATDAGEYVLPSVVAAASEQILKVLHSASRIPLPPQSKQPQQSTFPLAAALELSSVQATPAAAVISDAFESVVELKQLEVVTVQSRGYSATAQQRQEQRNAVAAAVSTKELEFAVPSPDKSLRSVESNDTNLHQLTALQFCRLLLQSGCDWAVPAVAERSIDGKTLVELSCCEQLLEPQFGLQLVAGQCRAKQLFKLIRKWQLDGVESTAFEAAAFSQQLVPLQRASVAHVAMSLLSMDYQWAIGPLVSRLVNGTLLSEVQCCEDLLHEEFGIRGICSARLLFTLLLQWKSTGVEV